MKNDAESSDQNLPSIPQEQNSIPSVAHRPQFEYEPLSPGEIRLLTPTGDVSGLSWTLKAVSLDDETLEFDALSYTWGSQDSVFPILCNGRRHQVHYNLYTALPYLARRREVRKPAGPHEKEGEGKEEEEEDEGKEEDEEEKEAEDNNLSRESSIEEDGADLFLPIWIDALCINQSNEDEKLVQVSAMNKVYRRAKKVWIWLDLGEEDSFVEDAMTILPVVMHAGRRLQQAEQESEGAATDVNEWMLFDELDEISETVPLWSLILYTTEARVWSALDHLLCNEWFRRVWVIQEFLLAQDVMFVFGRAKFSVPVFDKAVELSKYVRDFMWSFWEEKAMTTALRDLFHSYTTFNLRSTYQDHVEFMQSILSSSDLRRKAAKTLLDVSIRMSKSQRCYLPRDRVVGMLGILTPEQYESLGEDLYSIKETPKLYTRFSSLILIHTLTRPRHFPDLASWAFLDLACKPKSVQGLPSWVPDLHSPSDPNFGLMNLEYRSSDRQCMVREGNHDNHLVICGRLAHTVAVVCAEIPTTWFMKSEKEPTAYQNRNLYYFAEWEFAARETFLALYHIEAKEGERVPLPTPEGEHYWRTLLGDEVIHEKDAITQKDYEDFHAMLQLFKFCWLKYFEECEPDFQSDPEPEEQQQLHVIEDDAGVDAGAEAVTRAKSNTGWSDQFEIGIDALNVSELDENRETGPDPSSWLQKIWTMNKHFQDKSTPEGRFLKYLESLQNRSMFFTADGKAGLTTQRVHEGDRVCIFNGAPTPHILRRAVDQAIEAYRLVDAAYIHGLMHEEIDGMDLEDQEVELV